MLKLVVFSFFLFFFYTFLGLAPALLLHLSSNFLLEALCLKGPGRER